MLSIDPGPVVSVASPLSLAGLIRYSGKPRGPVSQSCGAVLACTATEMNAARKDGETGDAFFMVDRQSSYSYDELLTCAEGELFGPGNAQLPLPPMLMVHRITDISETGGEFDKGYLRAEFDITPDLWFFPCHFKGNPVMPGCLGLDGMWQLTGFYLGWLGEQGRGMALSTGEVKFKGMVTPDVKLVEYGIDFKRVMRGRLVLGIANGWLKADGETIYNATDLKVGLAKDKTA